MKKAVIFDLDGTLLNTIDDIADSMNSVLERNSFPGFPVERYKEFVGNGVEMLIKRVVPSDKQEDSALIKQLIHDFKTEYEKNSMNKTKIYDGIFEMLEELSDKNIFLSILSNKPEYLVKKLTEFYLPYRHFVFIKGAVDNKPKKPDPIQAVEISRNLNIKPDEFLFIGDTKTDVKTALNSGMVPIGVSWGFRERTELKEFGALAIVEKPREIIQLLEKEEF